MLNSPQIRQLVVGQVYFLEHGQLCYIDWQLGHAHAAEVERFLIAALSVPDLQLDFLHYLVSSLVCLFV